MPNKSTSFGSRTAWLVAIVAVAILTGGVGGYLVGHRGVGNAAPATESTAAVVDVTISGLNMPAPSTLAALLYRGEPSREGFRAGVGGFVAPVSANVYRVTDVVRAGSPGFEHPTVARPIAQLPAGRYTLWVVIDSHLSWYNEWVPTWNWGAPSPYMCKVQLDVNAAAMTTVQITGVPRGPLHNPGYISMGPNCPVTGR